MKALTLTQPWASLMHLREKTIETRSWPTKYRGELVIHAAKGFPSWAREQCVDPVFARSLNHMPASTLPLSRLLCVVELIDCVRTEDLPLQTVKEYAFGDYSEGRFAWITRYVRALDDDRIVKGALGIWTITDSDDKKAQQSMEFAKGRTLDAGH